MQEFTPGQRWVSDNDAALGLGIVKSVDFRTVQIEFPAAGETRNYAKNNAPLTRVEFDTGDTVESVDGWQITVQATEDISGTIRYHGVDKDGKPVTMHECELSDEITFNLPQDKLFAGQIDDNKWFELRASSLKHLATQLSTRTFGLHGPRVSLIPHQIYVANEVSNRDSPRVLLADEVGLGKTIEAGLILHRLALTGKVQRALIVVPEPLLHQWLVELLRRFNLSFTLLDDKALISDSESEGDSEAGDETPIENPFDQQSLVLCGLDFICREEIGALAERCDWDMLIVDEAHHLEWTPQKSSREYDQIERLSHIADAVLLLTATPEQLGAAGHFARLRLLDPARFHSLESYLEEENHHAQTATLVNALLDNENIDGEQLSQLHALLDDDIDINVDTLNDDTDRRNESRETAINHLLDQHGTGRILFRNTRANISGFPRRLFVPAELAEDKHSTRVEWLADKVRSIYPNKALLICASADTADELSKSLLNSQGLQSAVFHEQMSIVERDRAAAWFADAEEGARLLICSEIGSEGRNFQFLHHIILFDLPDNPDLLEQRIGRLDRIGQQFDICIHVPVVPDSRDARLRDWYQNALNAFEKSCVTGNFIKSNLLDEFNRFVDGTHPDAEGFINSCKTMHSEKMRELERGRNRLLELNACRKEIAEPLIETINQSEQTNELTDYLEQAFDCFGVDVEDHSLSSWIIRPSDHLQVEQFPELPEDGMTVTSNRETALAREELHFLSWEHPIVRATLDLVINGDKGSVSICALKMPQLPARSILIEALFESNCPAPVELHVERYLARDALRVLIDKNGRNYSEQLPVEKYDALLENVDREVALQMIDMTRTNLKKQLQHLEIIADEHLPAIRSTALESMHAELDPELHRLSTLQKRNPTIRPEEINAMQSRIDQLDQRLASSTLTLSALRVIYTH